MTPGEVKENVGEVVAVRADGMVCGFAYEKIVDYDLEIKTPWGKGIVKTEGRNGGNGRNGRKVVTRCLSQLELYDENYIPRHKQKRRRKKNDKEISASDNKRKRKRKTRKRIRKRAK